MALFSKKKTTEKSTDKVVATSEETTNDLRVAPKKIEAKKIIKIKDIKNPVAYKELIFPLLTEKSTILGSLNQYVFAVAKSSNKVQIKKAVAEIYGITPIKVNIINNVGKKVRSGRSKSAKLKDWKKAIVILPQGKSIDIYEGV